MIMKTRLCYYSLVIAILEKYGFEVITSNDFKTIFVTRDPEGHHKIIFTDLEKIFRDENLDGFIDDIEPVHIATWKIKTI